MPFISFEADGLDDYLANSICAWAHCTFLFDLYGDIEIVGQKLSKVPEEQAEYNHQICLSKLEGVPNGSPEYSRVQKVFGLIANKDLKGLFNYCASNHDSIPVPLLLLNVIAINGELDLQSWQYQIPVYGLTPSGMELQWYTPALNLLELPESDSKYYTQIKKTLVALCDKHGKPAGHLGILLECIHPFVMNDLREPSVTSAKIYEAICMTLEGKKAHKCSGEAQTYIDDYIKLLNKCYHNIKVVFRVAQEAIEDEENPVDPEDEDPDEPESPDGEEGDEGTEEDGTEEKEPSDEGDDEDNDDEKLRARIESITIELRDPDEEVDLEDLLEYKNLYRCISSLIQSPTKGIGISTLGYLRHIRAFYLFSLKRETVRKLINELRRIK